MSDLLAFLQNAVAVAFGVLGLAVAITWVRRRDRSIAYLALAIIMLSLVATLGRVPALLGYTPPLVGEVGDVCLVASGYALLRYRMSLIPISRSRHIAIVIAMAGITIMFFASEALVNAHLAPVAVETANALALLAIWGASVVEPVIRFWLVSNRLEAVQRWRLRSLSLGFATLVLILAFALVAGSLASVRAVQVGAEVGILAIVPLLYASFSPPAWLRREWRAAEEEGLRAFMERLLLSDDHEVLASDALEWVMRLTGGTAALAVDRAGMTIAVRGIEAEVAEALADHLPPGAQGVVPIPMTVGGKSTVLVIPITVLEGQGRLVVFSGPFTPGFGSDEVNRVQQFMSAVTTALDRQRLIHTLRDTNTRLDKANTYKSIFLANMSHELRTPLNAIIGFSELLIDSADKQYDHATRIRFLNQIHAGGKHLLGLINDILDLSKIEAGQMELRLEMAPIPDVLDEAMRTLEPLAAQKHIHIDWQQGPRRRALVDPGKLKQMILNLVSNAIKFTPDGGEISVVAKWEDSSFEIAVTDSGIGIAPIDQSRIFEEFQQVDSGAGRAQQGTGLGLTLTRRFAHLHGGDVTVHSEMGRGSTFTLALPLRGADSKPALAAVRSDPAMQRPAGPLVLVVEDNLSAAELVAHNLARGGFQTTIATTGRDALAKAKELRPLAITLDVMLPELDGWEVLARLKKDPATAEIPVVIVSVVDNPELGIALGALDYFVKPVEATALVRSLSRYNFRRRHGHDDCEVLVVDDELANRDLLREILEPIGFNVTLAGGGEEALQLAAKSPFDLVLLDLMMPGVSGFEVVEGLRGGASTSTIPIIVLTAKDLTDADKEQLNGRVSRILARRSTGAADLLSQVQEVLVHRGVPA